MSSMKIVDLSHPIFTGMPVYPGDPVVTITPATTIEEDGFSVLSVHMGSQSGTHIDAPFHFINAGARIDQIPLDHFYGTGCVIDVRSVGCSAITVAHLDVFAPNWREFSILVLHTGWDAFWGTDEYFVHPWMTPELAQEMVTHGVTTVAIDALSVDPTQLGEGNEFPAHFVLLGAGCVIAENLTNLAEIGVAEATISLLPLKLAGADGAPIRATAIVP